MNKKTTDKNRPRETVENNDVELAIIITGGVMVLGVIYLLVSFSQSLVELKTHEMDAMVAAQTEKAHAIRDIAIVALQQRIDGSFNSSLNAVVECDYDGWKNLPYGVNKTTGIAQVFGMMPDKAHCVIKGAGGFGGSGSIPVALMDEDTMALIKAKAEALS